MTSLEKHYLNRTDLPVPTDYITKIKIVPVGTVGFELWVTQGLLDVWHPMPMLFSTHPKAYSMALVIAGELGIYFSSRP